MYKAYPVTISKTLCSIFLVLHLVAIIAKYARTPPFRNVIYGKWSEHAKTRQKLQDFECVAHI